MGEMVDAAGDESGRRGVRWWYGRRRTVTREWSAGLSTFWKEGKSKGK